MCQCEGERGELSTHLSSANSYQQVSWQPCSRTHNVCSSAPTSAAATPLPNQPPTLPPHCLTHNVVVATSAHWRRPKATRPRKPAAAGAAARAAARLGLAVASDQLRWLRMVQVHLKVSHDCAAL